MHRQPTFGRRWPCSYIVEKTEAPVGNFSALLPFTNLRASMHILQLSFSVSGRGVLLLRKAKPFIYVHQALQSPCAFAPSLILSLFFFIFYWFLVTDLSPLPSLQMRMFHRFNSHPLLFSCVTSHRKSYPHSRLQAHIKGICICL